jgi:hypothetical protein
LTDWTQVAAIATGVAAVVGSASLIAIAWQAWETRKTAGAARDSLEIGRASLKVSQQVAVEATKARLDARAPRLLVTAALAESEVARGRSGSGIRQVGAPWPGDREFRRTEDDYQVLAVGAQIDITNEGDRSVNVWIDGSTLLLRPSIPPAKQSNGRLTVALLLRT